MTKSDPSNPVDVKNAIKAWQKHIKKAKGNIKTTKKVIKILKKAVKAACTSWWNPFSWVSDG